MLRGNGSTRFLGMYETHMCNGNELWADPKEALRVGEIVGEELVGRHEHLNGAVGEQDTPPVSACALKVMEDALEVVDYAALPTERRANILRGVINALAATGALGGEPEWATSAATTPPSP